MFHPQIMESIKCILEANSSTALRYMVKHNQVIFILKGQHILLLWIRLGQWTEHFKKHGIWTFERIPNIGIGLHERTFQLENVYYWYIVFYIAKSTLLNWRLYFFDFANLWINHFHFIAYHVWKLAFKNISW